jgi:hypothetical protein
MHLDVKMSIKINNKYSFLIFNIRTTTNRLITSQTLFKNLDLNSVYQFILCVNNI